MKVLFQILLVMSVSIFASLVLSSLMAYLFFCPRINDKLVSTILFHPIKLNKIDKDMLSINGIKGREVSFQSLESGPMLNGIFYRHPKEKFVVIVNHGNGGNVLSVKQATEALLESQSSVFVYDYRGYGKSGGAPNLPGVVQDARSAYKFVSSSLNYASDKIVLYGASLGSGITSEVANYCPCRGIILDSPFVSLEELAKEKSSLFSVYPSILWTDPSLNNMKLVRQNHPPILIISAKNDRVIPSSHGKKLCSSGVGEISRRVFNNSVHCNFARDLKAYRTTLREFIQSLRKKVRQKSAVFAYSSD